MTVAEILAALQGIIAEAMPDPADMAADPAAAPQLNADQAARYEALEAQLLVARKSEEIVKRNAAYNATATNVPVASGFQVNEDKEIGRAFNEYLRTGRVNPSYVSRAQSEGTAAAGGVFVPESFRGKLIEKLKAFGGLQNEAESLSTGTGNPVYWLTNDDVLSTEAGISSEAATLSAAGADFTFGKNTLNAYKYSTGGASNTWLKISWELLQDTDYDIEGFVARKFAERIARKLATDLINGTGVSEPQGLISTQGALTSSGVTVTSATAGPTYAELVTIEHSLDPAYRDSAKWLMNDKTMSLIEQLVDTTGRPLVWGAGNSVSEGRVPKTLLGYPVVIDQAMPDCLTGSTKGIVFGNLNAAYVVRSVKDFTLVTTHELFAANGQVGYLGWARFDGMVQDPNAAVYVTSHS
jgi:HK97 family phage major capsid protein